MSVTFLLKSVIERFQAMKDHDDIPEGEQNQGMTLVSDKHKKGKEKGKKDSNCC